MIRAFSKINKDPRFEKNKYNAEENPDYGDMVPVELWMIIFGILAYKDFATVFRFKLVCISWNDFFNESISEATICRPHVSLQGIVSLVSLRSLTIKSPIFVSEEMFNYCFTRLKTLVLCDHRITCSPKVTPQMWAKLTNLKTLDFSKTKLSPERQDNENFIVNSDIISLLTNLNTLKTGNATLVSFDSMLPLVNLTKLKIDHSQILLSQHWFDLLYGNQLEFLGSIQELKEVKIFMSDQPPFSTTRFNIFDIQKKFPPYVTFRWFSVNNNDVDEDDTLDDDESSDNYFNNNKILYYEGMFSENNKYHGKGKLSFKNGDKYEGYFVNGNMEGKGVYYYTQDHLNREKYEGDFIKNKKEGRGVLSYNCSTGFCYERYEGEFKNDKIEGKGIYYYPNGDKYEGEEGVP
jgi:hypothetical protein